MKLDERMKEYEHASRHYLTRRTPVIIRIDGRAFHTFTRNFTKPFDELMVHSMHETMKYLCEHIQGCVLGYTQSDEITLVLVDYQKRDTDAWFNDNIQKMVSISASMATLKFNNIFEILYYKECHSVRDEDIYDAKIADPFSKYTKSLHAALFDSRAFNIPKEEVVNCLIWRQQDAVRNSISAVAQSQFSDKQLHNKSQNEMQDMLMREKGINWNDFRTHLKRGCCCIKQKLSFNDGLDGEYIRTKWIIDKNIPIFTEDKLYIENLVLITKEILTP